MHFLGLGCGRSASTDATRDSTVLAGGQRRRERRGVRVGDGERRGVQKLAEAAQRHAAGRRHRGWRGVFRVRRLLRRKRVRRLRLPRAASSPTNAPSASSPRAPQPGPPWPRPPPRPLSAARRAAASCSVSRSTYSAPAAAHGRPAAAATTMSASPPARTTGWARRRRRRRAVPRRRCAASAQPCSRWKAMAMLTWCATLRTSSMSSPAHVNSSDATSIIVLQRLGGGGGLLRQHGFRLLGPRRRLLLASLRGRVRGLRRLGLLAPAQTLDALDELLQLRDGLAVKQHALRVVAVAQLGAVPQARRAAARTSTPRRRGAGCTCRWCTTSRSPRWRSRWAKRARRLRAGPGPRLGLLRRVLSPPRPPASRRRRSSSATAAPPPSRRASGDHDLATRTTPAATMWVSRDRALLGDRAPHVPEEPAVPYLSARRRLRSRTEVHRGLHTARFAVVPVALGAVAAEPEPVGGAVDRLRDGEPCVEPAWYCRGNVTTNSPACWSSAAKATRRRRGATTGRAW